MIEYLCIENFYEAYIKILLFYYFNIYYSKLWVYNCIWKYPLSFLLAVHVYWNLEERDFEHFLGASVY